MDFTEIDWGEIGIASVDTLKMVGFSLLFTILLGLPVGIFLFLLSKGQFLENRILYGILSSVVNGLRSIPFIILMIVVIPFSIFLTGTSMGVIGSIPPLVIGAAPFFARLVEMSLREVDRGVIEAAQSMGATLWQLVWTVLIPESKAGLIAGVTVTAVTLVSYTAMSGVIGGGGLGDLAVRYGYQRFQTDIMLITVIVLILFVQGIQFVGDRLVLRMSRK
jgi:D-methionine transport system permease protein